MKQLGRLVCRTFIEKRKRDSRKELFSFLSPKERELVLNLSAPSHDISLGFDLTADVLNGIHSSWLIPFLRQFSEKEICLFLSSLDKTKAEHLKKSLKCCMPLVSLTEPAQKFFKEKMARFLLTEAEDLIPIEALAKTSLKPLLALSSEDLHLTIELLGLHDLAVELKQIIDSTQLKKIYSIFPKEKEVYLKSLAHKKEPVLFKKLEISRWDGKAETLLPLLFQRGLNRLGKALYPESPDFIWYVKHRMEVEEAALLSSLCKSLEHVKAYTYLSEQVLDAISFVQKITIKPSGSS
jgi:hypothetical protein